MTHHSIKKAAEPILEPQAEREHGLLISHRAGPERHGNFDGRAALAALCQRDGVRAALVSQRLSSRAFRGIQGCGRRAPARLLPKLSIRDARPCDQLHQRKRELVAEELVMGK